jgi:hypothetical protein
MTCIGEGVRGGDWCRVPPTFWLNPAAAVEALLTGCNSSTSGMSLKVRCDEPSVMVERICVGGRFWVEV